jgi:tRNA (guanine-N7-)-methyltransferase
MRVRTHSNPLNYFHRMEKIDFSRIFPNFSGTIELEIGFGRGLFLRHYAKLHPEINLVGIEVRKSITGILKEKLTKENINNLHLIHGNGQILLEDSLGDFSCKNIFVFHPDPWLKTRHHKRRIINQKLLNIACKKLCPKGNIYITTDVESLWQDMQTQIELFNKSQTNYKFKKTEDQEFWQSKYKTHWHEFSQKDQRDFFFGVFTLQKQSTIKSIKKPN